MKNILIMFVIALSCIKCSCQDEYIAWLPENYVIAVMSGDTLAIKYLSPFEGFESHSDSLYVLTFRGEVNPVMTKKVIENGNTKYELLNLEYYINLKYNSRDLASRLSKASVFISKSNNKLLLEIIEGDNVERIYFINKIGEYNFKSIRSAKEYLIK